ncbi:MAG TPA: hypothetical protein PKE12_12040 [Kiritimatiellia bacterium]|nr:hypothetical protein [Kiritimatiellia bacterium]
MTVLALCGSAGCAGPRVATSSPDAMLAQYISSAQSAFALGSFDRAGRFYELALQRARAMDDAVEVGKQAYNLAASLVLQERPADALPYLAEAEAAFARLRRDRGPVHLLRARALRASSQAAAAKLEIQRVVELNTPNEVQCQGWLLYGQIAVDESDAKEAAKALARARSLLTDDPALRAGVAALAGRIALLKGEGGDAGLEFDKEAEFMRRAGRFRDMAAALERAGEACARAGDVEAAGFRYYRAARSWHGQGDPVRALKAVEQALALPGAEQDAAWAPELAALFAEIKRTPLAGGPAEQIE